MSWTVPLTDVVVAEEDVEAVLACYRDGWLTMGPRTQELERRFAELVGVQHAVAVSSGTAALHLALLAAGIGPGDEVLVPALTFVAGAAAVRACGGVPVLVDSVGPHDPNLDPQDAAARVTARTRAILPTHFMGYACDLAAVRALADEHGLRVVEDCAQAVLARDADGARVGSRSDAGCFSFFSKKQLCVGEGGMVTTDDETLAAKVRSLRSHAMTSVTWDRHRGHAESYDILDVGFNYRLDEPRAALGLSRLGRLEADLDRRRAMTQAYRQALAGLDGVLVPWDDDALVERATHFCFAVLLEDLATRDRVREELAARGIQTTWYPALTMFSGYADAGSRPRAEAIAARHTALPLSSSFGAREVDLVIGALREILA
ncbi:aminotransferase class I/II-fold pyridoxal phosphate-dependent enzyme [Conexibacter sp. W3-3-2]|uniref:DegT/DnrJ/EryC1/StrS family aminotransferase n=1 Tax=Conexibacter sp. W3-3-2 TaxID=2675227 RepID=UPI0012B79622|nr:DegT/DnrJ/EryC1/StrS family aminotransferase [Conexibacter sp. W3-3-2]MTD44731.1 aminotransferase class I/II-fold pyridoxal phosphate-dependent enzyme [Conexibacter sp. W3-3-2]